MLGIVVIHLSKYAILIWVLGLFFVVN